MKHINVTALFCLGLAAFAQEVQFDYDRSANFNAYKTYQWVDYKPVEFADQLLDQDIKRAVDGQLAGKGLRRVESGGDLHVGYQTAITQEKQFDSFGWGPGAWGPGGWGNWGNGRVTTSTIEVGKLIVGVFDPATKQLVWRGSVSKALNISKNPEKNYRNLEKAVAKLFKNYPPRTNKTANGSVPAPERLILSAQADLSHAELRPQSSGDAHTASAGAKLWPRYRMLAATAKGSSLQQEPRLGTDVAQGATIRNCKRKEQSGIHSSTEHFSEAHHTFPQQAGTLVNFAGVDCIHA